MVTAAFSFGIDLICRYFVETGFIVKKFEYCYLCIGSL